MNVLFILVYWFVFQIEKPDFFTSKNIEPIKLSKEQIEDLNRVGNSIDANEASIALIILIPDEFVELFNSSKICIENNPIKNMRMFSQYTKYSAYDDLIRYCVLTEYNKKTGLELNIDDMSLLLFYWSESLVSHIIYDSKNKPLLIEYYVNKKACDNTIYYHLFISTLMMKIELKDFESIDFLRYLFYGKGYDSSSCKDFSEFWE